MPYFSASASADKVGSFDAGSSGSVVEVDSQEAGTFGVDTAAVVAAVAVTASLAGDS